MTPLTAQWSTPAAERIAAFLRRETGLEWSPDRLDGLEQAVAEQAARFTHGSAEGLADLIESDVARLDDLVSEITIGETYFFRDRAQFDVLTEHILPDLQAAHGTALRAWSAGCASGEEAYSLAIAMAESGVDQTFPVLGTDISRAALRCAGEATYRSWSFRGVPDSVRDRYFIDAGDGKRPLEALQRRVRFEWLNLASSAYPSRRSGISEMHLIFCRNVLIYLTRDAIATVAQRLHESLAPGGWLVTGASDPDLADHAPFESVLLGERLFYRRLSAETARHRAESLERPAPAPLREAAPVIASRARPRRGTTVAVRPRIASQPPDVTESIREIRRLADAGEHRAAGERAVSGLKRAPESAELAYLLAVILLERGDYDAAVIAARRACYLEPTLVVAVIALGSALRHSGDLRGARAAYRRARAQLQTVPDAELVALADGECAGGLRATVDACLALLERRS